MDVDLKEAIEFLHATARSLGAEVTSPWFYLQFGLILAAAGIAWASDAAIHLRVDMTSLAMRWPVPLRRLVRVMVGSASTAVFAILMIAARVTMYAFDLAEPRLSARGFRQAGAGLAGHPSRDLGHSQRVHRQAGVAVSLVDGGAQHHRPA